MSFRNQFFSAPLMMQPEACAAFHLELLKPAVDQALINDLRDKKENDDEILTVFKEGTAVILIDGAIAKGTTEVERWFYNLADLDIIGDAIATVSQNPLVKKVIFAINSPGGVCTGVPELAAKIAKLSEVKETYTYVDAMCCSCAYYLASQTGGIAATKSAIVGSVGTYMVNMEYSRQLENAGVTVNIIKAGKFKTMSSSLRPMTDEERDLLQARCDELNDEFIAACKANRKIEDGALEGQWFLGSEASQKGLVDKITDMTLDEFVASSL